MIFKKFNDTDFDGVMYNAFSLFQYPSKSWGIEMVYKNDNGDEITSKIITSDIEDNHKDGIYVQDNVFERKEDFIKLVNKLIEVNLVNKMEANPKPLYNGSYYDLMASDAFSELMNHHTNLNA